MRFLLIVAALILPIFTSCKKDPKDQRSEEILEKQQDLIAHIRKLDETEDAEEYYRLTMSTLPTKNSLRKLLNEKISDELIEATDQWIKNTFRSEIIHQRFIEQFEKDKSSQGTYSYQIEVKTIEEIKNLPPQPRYRNPKTLPEFFSGRPRSLAQAEVLQQEPDVYGVMRLNPQKAKSNYVGAFYWDGENWRDFSDVLDSVNMGHEELEESREEK